MFVRCERCRALYELDVAPGTQPFVSCGRCANVFSARFPVTRLAPAGVIGGAAAAPPPPAKVPAASPARGRENASGLERARRSETAEGGGRGALVVVVVVLVVLLAAGAWFLLRRKPRTTLASLPPAAAAKVVAAQVAIAKDDAASLEQAIAAFADAATIAPDHAELKVERGFATVLAGASLKSEATDLNVVIAHLERDRRTLSQAGADEARKAAVSQRIADARARAQVAQAQGDKLAKEGFELARSAASDAGDDSLEVVRALTLAWATNQDATKLEAVAKRLDDDADEPWIDYARGYLRTLGRVSPQKAGEAKTWLEKALASNPNFLRAKWDLGRLAIASNPPDLDRAERLFGQVALANPSHEGAHRGLELVETLRATSAIAVPDAPPPP